MSDTVNDSKLTVLAIKPSYEKISSSKDKVRWSLDQASRGTNTSYALTHQPCPSDRDIFRDKVDLLFPNRLKSLGSEVGTEDGASVGVLVCATVGDCSRNVDSSDVTSNLLIRIRGGGDNNDEEDLNTTTSLPSTKKRRKCRGGRKRKNRKIRSNKEQKKIKFLTTKRNFLTAQICHYQSQKFRNR